jgi:hypothetical protein
MKKASCWNGSATTVRRFEQAKKARRSGGQEEA